MKNIEEIALRVAAAYEALSSIDDCARMDIGVDAIGPRMVLEQFIADVEKLAELSKQEPVAWLYRSEDPFDAGQWLVSYDKINRREIKPLYELPLPIEAIEQRTAEACAELIMTDAGACDTHVIATQIICGKWREYL